MHLSLSYEPLVRDNGINILYVFHLEGSNKTQGGVEGVNGDVPRAPSISYKPWRTRPDLPVLATKERVAGEPTTSAV